MVRSVGLVGRLVGTLSRCSFVDVEEE